MSDVSGTPPFDSNRPPQDGIPPYTPPPGQPNPSTPPPSQPPPSAAPPPPGAPPGPAYPAAAYGQPVQQPQKKRWPWVLGGCFIGLLLLAGGCAALVVFGFREIGQVEDEIVAEVDTMFMSAINDDFAEGATVAEGTGDCLNEAGLEDLLATLDPTSYTVDSVLFVQRNGGAFFSNSPGDEDSIVIDGRSNASSAIVDGTLETTSGTEGYVVELLDGGNGWQVCSLARTQ